MNDEPPSPGEASSAHARIEALADEARRALDDAPLPSDAAHALRQVAELVAGGDEAGSDGSLRARSEDAP